MVDDKLLWTQLAAGAETSQSMHGHFKDGFAFSTESSRILLISGRLSSIMMTAIYLARTLADNTSFERASSVPQRDSRTEGSPGCGEPVTLWRRTGESNRRGGNYVSTRSACSS